MAESKGLEQLAKAQELYVTYHLSGIDEHDAEILHHLDLAMELGLSTDCEVMVHFTRGHIYLDRERLPEAEAELAKAIELNRQSRKKLSAHLLGQTWEHLNTLHGKQGDRDQKIRCLEEGIKQLQVDYDQREMDVKDALVRLHVLLGLNHEGLDNMQAHSIFQQALQIDPQHPLLHWSLGWFYCNKKDVPEFYDPRKAIEHWEQYLTLEKYDEDMKQKIKNNLEQLKKEVKAKEEPKKGFFKKLFG